MIINSGENGILIPVNDRKAMSEAVNKLIEDKNLCEKLSKNAINIREKLSEDFICSQWEKLMENEND